MSFIDVIKNRGIPEENQNLLTSFSNKSIKYIFRVGQFNESPKSDQPEFAYNFMFKSMPGILFLEFTDNTAIAVFPVEGSNDSITICGIKPGAELEFISETGATKIYSGEEFGGSDLENFLDNPISHIDIIVDAPCAPGHQGRPNNKGMIFYFHNNKQLAIGVNLYYGNSSSWITCVEKSKIDGEKEDIRQFRTIERPKPSVLNKIKSFLLHK